MIDLVFYIAAGKGIIAKERPSNKIDMAYLYYLPFCHVFLTGNKLHLRTAQYFMRQDQSLINLKSFKQACIDFNTYYEKFTTEIAEAGVMKFATYPPADIDNTITQLWDTFCPNWRNDSKKQNHSIDSSDSKLSEWLKKREALGTPVRNQAQYCNEKTIDYMVIEKNVRVQKGKWRILPKDIEKQNL